MADQVSHPRAVVAVARQEYMETEILHLAVPAALVTRAMAGRVLFPVHTAGPVEAMVRSGVQLVPVAEPAAPVRQVGRVGRAVSMVAEAQAEVLEGPENTEVQVATADQE